ncbi:P-loop containing nucleoside triphosphate hydrolase [Pseudocohnilembus persalinus]|uniref:p-loop containing nucleoside triphosphate hydrolase n=1 Tax=Pseudocohnilembus persalinus TaxID=266149 RepID=A0A0V0R087_PSEPJ|nr:P-loop containing nucleoside triphosphate hydrolase [Pseudocohnilembus persalinus]|eukprot:KRX07924.1 P-loop containing nucleoside triphosphate hydrolase [Pseudocohnilembus persalinus]
MPGIMQQLFEIKQSLKKIQEFLHSHEIEEKKTIVSSQNNYALVIKNGNFQWKKQVNQKSEKNKQQNNYFQLKNIDIQIEKGKLVGLLGNLGSGKSSLIYGIIGEMQISSQQQNMGQIQIQGKIALVSQKPWIISGNVKENVIFGMQEDDKKYNEILELTCLKQDLQNLHKGDQTRIQQNGDNLSGGQKTRIALARALYSDADIYLFDGILSALDIQVADQIFQNCILKYLKGKTVLFITHSASYLKFMDYLYYMENGKIIKKGHYQQIQDNLNCIYNQQSPQQYKDMQENDQKIILNNDKNIGNNQQITKRKEIIQNCQEKVQKVEIIKNKSRQESLSKFRLNYIWEYFKINGGIIYIFGIIFAGVLQQICTVNSSLWIEL